MSATKESSHSVALDEDELDDLDDFLDDFNAPPEAASTLSSSSNGLGRNASQEKVKSTSSGSCSKNLADDISANDIEAEFQKQMAALLQGSDQPAAIDRDLQQMVQDLAVGDSTTTPERLGSSGENTSPKANSEKPSNTQSNSGDRNFDNVIRKTLERLERSEKTPASQDSDSNPDELLAQLIKDIQNEEPSGEGDGDALDGNLDKMLVGMMDHLTNKDILYQPMKDLHTKFPSWFVKNRATTEIQELRRFERQQVLVREIVDRFERKDYADSNEADREFIVDRMQKMQAAGSPPNDLFDEKFSAGSNDEKDPDCAPQ